MDQHAKVLCVDDERDPDAGLDPNEGELIAMARAGGMKTLLEDGIEKVRQGETTLKEILRVIGAQTRYERECPNCRRRTEASFHFCPFCGEFKKDGLAKKEPRAKQASEPARLRKGRYTRRGACFGVSLRSLTCE